MKVPKSWFPAGVALFVVLSGIAVLLLRGVHNENYRDSKVAGGEVVRPLNLLAVHSSQLQYLTVNGQTYRGVRGLPPYYLDVPTLNSILFVTGDIGGQTVFHLVNLLSKQEIKFNGGTSGFGGHIGANRRPHEPFRDYIEGVSSNEVTLAKRTPYWMERTVLNLKTKRVERLGTVYFQADGVQTNS
jgi:hypothetical protein